MLRDGLEGRPKYSMASRHFLKESERSPGPAAYFPTKWALDNRPPEYTMGMKLRYEKGFVTPGTSVAACYKLAPLNVEARTTVCLSVCLSACPGRTVVNSKKCKQNKQYTIRVLKYGWDGSFTTREK